MKAIIMCAGQQKRWSLEIPKQLAFIDGEKNLIRTVNMLHQLKVLPEDIHVIVNNKNAQQFSGLGLNLTTGSSFRRIDMFRNGFSIMEKSDKTIFLWGNVVYSKSDLEQILKADEYCFFGQKTGNKLTGKSYKEIFAVVVTDADDFKEQVQDVASKFEKRKLVRESAWEVYANRHEKKNILNKFIEVSEMTDDFDTVEEYARVSKIYNKSSQPLQL